MKLVCLNKERLCINIGWLKPKPENKQKSKFKLFCVKKILWLLRIKYWSPLTLTHGKYNYFKADFSKANLYFTCKANIIKQIL